MTLLFFIILMISSVQKTDTGDKIKYSRLPNDTETTAKF